MKSQKSMHHQYRNIGKSQILSDRQFGELVEAESESSVSTKSINLSGLEVTIPLI